MKKAAVFGVGANFFRYEGEMRKTYEICCLGDNNRTKWGGTYKGLEILSVDRLKNENFDCVLVPATAGKMEIMNSLLEAGIPCEKIIPWFHGEGRLWKEKEVIYQGNNLCRARFDDLRFACRNSFELAVVQEVYFDNEYGCGLGGSKNDVVVIDIGMNVGLTALFLARFAQVKAVYGFEPFPHICEKALENIGMNDDVIKNKIFAKNVGLSNYEGTEYFSHDSMHTLNPLEAKSNEQKDEVKIVKAGREIKDIIHKNPGKKILVKIDVEGQEYNIFEEFDKENIIADIDVFMIETHLGREEELKSLLAKNGFVYFAQNNSVYTDLGMMYAVNMKH